MATSRACAVNARKVAVAPRSRGAERTENPPRDDAARRDVRCRHEITRRDRDRLDRLQDGLVGAGVVVLGDEAEPQHDLPVLPGVAEDQQRALPGLAGGALLLPQADLPPRDVLDVVGLLQFTFFFGKVTLISRASASSAASRFSIACLPSPASICAVAKAGPSSAACAIVALSAWA